MKFMHIVILVNKKELNEWGYLGIALDIFLCCHLFASAN